MSLLDLTAAQYGVTGASISAIDSATGVSFKMLMDAETFRSNLFGKSIWCIGDVETTSNNPDPVRKLNLILESVDTNANYRLRFETVDPSDNIGNTYATRQTSHWVKANLPANGTPLVLYGHWFNDASAEEWVIEIYQTDGTAEESSGNNTVGSDLTVLGSAGYVSIGGDLIGGIGHDIVDYDGMAIYSAKLSGADRYSEPSTGDANIIGYWPAVETTGTTIADDVAGGSDITISGGTWASGGSWNGAAAASGPLAGEGTLVSEGTVAGGSILVAG